MKNQSLAIVKWLRPLPNLLIQFWNENPCALYGICFLIGLSLVYSPLSFSLLTLFILQVSLLLAYPLSKKRWLQSCIFISLAAAYGYYFAPLPCHKNMTGQGQFHIDAVIPLSKPGKKWLFKGSLKTFAGKKLNIPCTLSLKSAQRPPADTDYLITGELKQVGQGHFFLKPKEWQPIPHTFSLAELRYRLKEKVKELLKDFYRPASVQQLLYGITLGVYDDASLRFHFGRMGCLHLLAISGFHLTLLITFCARLLRPFLSYKPLCLLLLLCVTLYLLFLGAAPPVLRAYLSCCFVLFGQILGKPTRPLNLLGASLLAVLLFQPHFMLHMGFQLTFIATAAILFFYQPLNAYLQSLTLISKEQTLMASFWKKHFYLFLGGVKQLLALTLAVDLFLVPWSLYTFHEFPLLALITNLFLPFVASIILFLFFTGSLLLLLSTTLGSAIHEWNSQLTHSMLDMMHTLPRSFDIYLRCASIASWQLTLYFIIFFVLGIYLNQESPGFSRGEVQ